MSKCFLLDTHACIYVINRRARHERLIERLGEFSYGDVLISSITMAELQFGVAKSQRGAENSNRLGLFLSRFEVAHFDEAAASRYGPLRALLEARGTPIGPLDTLIAAHALSLGATLVTNNVREFQRIPELSIENWLS